MTRSPFFVGFLRLSFLATVDIMLSSLCCFTIVVLIDGPRGPPPATSGPVTRDSLSSEQKPLAVVAKTEPAPERVAAKRTPQVDLAAPKVVQLVETSLSLDMSQVHLFIRAGARLLTDVRLFQLADAR